MNKLKVNAKYISSMLLCCKVIATGRLDKNKPQATMAKCFAQFDRFFCGVLIGTLIVFNAC